MAEDLNNFLENQNIVINVIKRLIINYKKPKANITLTTTRSRLADLQKHWEKMQGLHAKINLAATAGDRKNPYFLQDDFLAAEEAYYEASDLYLQEAISSYVALESPVYDPNPAFTVGNEPQSSSLTLPRIPLQHFRVKFPNSRNSVTLFIP
jgi:hypothetical protein